MNPKLPTLFNAAQNGQFLSQPIRAHYLLRLVSANYNWVREKKTERYINIYTRLPGAVPQPIGLFLFCIEFGWG